MKLYRDIQNNISNTNVVKHTIFLAERLIVGSGILLFIGIAAYIILFVLMCAI